MDGGEGKPNFTYDTLLRLKAELTVEAELFLLMGADSFRDLGRWYRGAEIPFVAGLIVASRPGEELGTGEALAQWLPEGIVLEAGEGNRYVLRNGKGERSAMTVLPDLQYEVSATLLRDQMLRAGGREPSLLDARVLSYIWEHDLYCRE
jgi:nicotinate-nucleotide adenylyltransferase